jgi:hypothetical protein
MVIREGNEFCVTITSTMTDWGMTRRTGRYRVP